MVKESDRWSFSWAHTKLDPIYPTHVGQTSDDGDDDNDDYTNKYQKKKKKKSPEHDR